MSTDKMREEFERVVGEGWENSPIHLKSLWEESWKASRATLFVDLPTGGYFAGYDNEHMMESRDVRDALDSADVRWK